MLDNRDRERLALLRNYPSFLSPLGKRVKPGAAEAAGTRNVEDRRV